MLIVQVLEVTPMADQGDLSRRADGPNASTSIRVGHAGGCTVATGGADRCARHACGVDFDPADPHNLIYARPADHWKVFVSSKMAGGALRDERAAALDAIDTFPLARAWAWERDANAGPYCSERECVAQAGTADGLVLVVDDELTPITRMEFEAARKGGAPVFLMLKQGAHRTPDLQRFIEDVRSFAITVNFASTGELKTQITQALRTWAIRSGRSAMLRIGAASAPGLESSASDPFEGIELIVENDAPVLVADIVQKARGDAQAGRSQDALSELWELAQSACDAGLSRLALALLDALEDIVDPTAIDDRWRGWILTREGWRCLRARVMPTRGQRSSTCDNSAVPSKTPISRARHCRTWAFRLWWPPDMMRRASTCAAASS